MRMKTRVRIMNKGSQLNSRRFPISAKFRLRIFLLLACGALAWANLSAFAVLRNWTGNSSGYWSDPNNWDPAGVPQNGEVLQCGSGSNTSMVNDIAGLVLSQLVFADEDHTLSGNELTITNPHDSIYNGYGYVVGNPSYTT